MNWVHVLIYVSLTILSIYGLVGLFVFLGFYIRPIQKSDPTNNTHISIIIPFRNEEKNLPHLLESLKGINYPEDKWDIILIDDHSTDGGRNLILQSGLTNFQIITNEGEGKKSAIITGLKSAKGDWIASTDTDTIVPSDWLIEINNASHHDMILGSVKLSPIKTILHGFQEYEFAALQSVTASSTYWKMPMMSNGANMAYRKELFEPTALRKETASGDDIFLLENFKKRKLSIQFIWKSSHTIRTSPVHSFTELISQKVRWASKSKYYKNFGTTALGFLVAFANLSMLMVFICPFIQPGLWMELGMIVLSKTIIDLLFVLPYLILIKKPQMVFLVPFFVVLYPFYFFIVLALSLRGNYTWKERKYHA